MSSLTCFIYILVIVFVVNHCTSGSQQKANSSTSGPSGNFFVQFFSEFLRISLGLFKVSSDHIPSLVSKSEHVHVAENMSTVGVKRDVKWAANV